MKLILSLVLWVVMFSTIFAVGLADYVPSFLVASQNNSKSSNNYPSNSSINTPMLVGINDKQSATVYSGNSNDFCKNSGADSVFCKQDNESATSKVSDASVESTSNPLKPKINTDPNLTSLQSQDLREALSKYNSGYMFNIAPKDNMSIGIGGTERGLNQLQFNMKY